MNRAGQNLALLVAGAALLWLTLAGHEYLNYVRPGFRLFLIAAGFLLCALGCVGLVMDWRHTGPGAEHDHGHGPRAAWLLLLPPLVIFAVTPSALGSFTAARAVNQGTPPAPHNALPADRPARISLSEFTARAFQARSGHDTLTGHQVTLTGFVTHDGPSRWLLVRLRMTCCAADAVAMRIAIDGAPAPPADTWIQVTGTWSRNWAKIHGIDTPRLTASGIGRITRPSDPYE